MNLYDVTKGNYRMVRIISYPEFPESQIVTKARVKAGKAAEWDTEIAIDGTYNGPTDVVSVSDYNVVWSRSGKEILESGSAKLVLSSGRSVTQVWSTTITPAKSFKKFPKDGELMKISISPFEMKEKSMSYKWEGSVSKRQLGQTKY